MQNKYKMVHTMTFIMSILTWWLAYALCIKIEFIPVIPATIIIATATLVQTFCWRAYLHRDAELEYSFKEILNALPTKALIELVEKRGDIACTIKEAKTTRNKNGAP